MTAPASSPASSLAPRLSVIVPMRNEAPGLPALLQRLMALRALGAEVILVDGGSEDGSLALACSAGAGVQLMSAEPGRARQMNAGAALARGDVLLFLHADTILPPDAPALIAASLARHVWGRFDVRIDGRAAMLAVVSRCMNWRSRLSGIATGDQAMFMTRAAFAAVGGFPDIALMEDIAMSARLLTLSSPACLRQRVVTSGRRWEQQGVWRTIFLMWRLRWAYWRGTSPADLAKAYR